MRPTSKRPLFVNQFISLILFSGSLIAGAQAPIASDASIQRAKALLKQMTVEEKIGQLNLASGFNAGALMKGVSDDTIAQGQVGSILYQANTQEINRLQHIAVEKSRLHIPLLFGLDVTHGYRTAFPVPLGMASSWDPSVEEKAQSFAANEARNAGIRWTYGPMVDIARDARWGRIQEGAGEDAYLGSAMAAAQVKGFQGPSLNPDSVIACVKHFAGYGAADGGRDYDSAYIPEELLRNVYLLPFQAALKAGVGSLMSGYMDLNDIPASGDRFLLTDILRSEWQFQGFVTSDASAIANLTTHGFASDPADASYKAILAGAGIDMISQTLRAQLPKLVAAGMINEAELDAAVLPILEAKYQIGLFEKPYVDEAAAQTGLTAEGRALARQLADRSMVLLKNDNATLPLSPSTKNVLVIGFLADSQLDVSGGGGGASFFNPGQRTSSVTVLAALKERLGPQAQINYVSGPGLPRVYPSIVEGFFGIKPVPQLTPSEITGWLAKTRAAAAKADLIIAVVGETAFMSGESASRSTLDLPGIQQQMLEAATVPGKPLVVVLQNGRPLDIRWAAEHVSAILESWMPGLEGGNAVVDTLFGDSDPGGKLPVSWPVSAGQEPLYYDHNLTHEPESDPHFMSRYWDMSSKPLYPFGYGLSYTKFKFANLRLSKNRMKGDGSTEVQVDVTNIGPVSGDAVAQLYVHQRSGSASRPVRQLKGFRRVALQPGETTIVSFKLGREELKFWTSETKAWVVDPVGFDIWVGEDSTASLHADLTVEP